MSSDIIHTELACVRFTAEAAGSVEVVSVFSLVAEKTKIYDSCMGLYLFVAVLHLQFLLFSHFSAAARSLAWSHN